MMKENERQLFRRLCSFKSQNFDETLLEAATPLVLGQLFFNRMQAVAYGTLRDRGLLGKVNREFRNSLLCAYEQNIEKNKSFFGCVMYLHQILAKYDYQYAMLKGAYLCRYYPQGFRTSNDIDLLVLPKDVTGIGNALMKAGFRQGYIRNGVFVSATRRDVIESKMMRGETVPYIKEVSLPGMQFLEVDINFSLDYKPGDTQLVRDMLEHTTVKILDGLAIPTLEESDFFVHLCMHLYKEATTLPWVDMRRDMTVYKYCDIYALLNDLDKDKTDQMFQRAKKLHAEKICAFAVLQTAALFVLQNTYAIGAAENILKEDEDFLHTVVAPKERKQYVFREKDILERFFSEDRIRLLKEVQSDEKASNETK